MSTDNQTRMRESQTLRETKVAAADAQATADAATDLAEVARETADGKGTRYDIVAGDPRPTGATEFDILYEWNGASVRDGNVSFMGAWDPVAEDWVSQELTTGAVANLDAGVISTGILNANNVEINATTSSGGHVRITGDGFEGLDASDNRKTFVGSDGKLVAEDAMITGTFRNGDPSVEALEIRPYDASGWGALVAIVAAGIVRSGLSLSLDEVTLAFSPEAGPNVARVNLENGIATLYGYVSSRLVSGASIHVSRTSASWGNIQITGSVDFTDTNTKQSARNSLGLGNTTGPVPIANGGTGATTAAGIRAAIGVGAVQDADFSGTITLTSAAGGLSGVFTLPSGMTQSNTLIHPSKQGSGLAKYIPYVNWVSSTTFQIGIYSGDGTSASGGVAVAAYARRVS